MVQPLIDVIDSKTPFSLTLIIIHDHWHLSVNEMQWLGATVNS